MPDDWVWYKAWHWGFVSYWRVYFQTPYPDGDWFVGPDGNPWAGWCVDAPHSMYSGHAYKVKLYSCYDPDLPAFAARDNWDMISYLITQRNKEWGIYDRDWSSNYHKQAFQDAVWYLKGGGTYPPAGSLARQFADDALANGDGFIPGPGEYYAVILFPDTSTNNNQYRAQMNIIEVDP